MKEVEVDGWLWDEQRMSAVDVFVGFCVLGSRPEAYGTIWEHIG
jgi:hypothetical protein